MPTLFHPATYRAIEPAEPPPWKAATHPSLPAPAAPHDGQHAQGIEHRRLAAAPPQILYFYNQIT